MKMQNNRNTSKTTFFLCVIIFMAVTISSCSPSDGLANAVIWELGPREEIGGNLIGYKGIIEFHIEITPRQPLYGTYTAVLLSHDNYIYDFTAVSWDEDDFATPDPEERDIFKINEVLGRPTRLLTLYAPSSDKDISALIYEFTHFYVARAQEALRHGEYRPLGKTGPYLGSFGPKESDYDKISNKYVKVVIVDDAGFDELLRKWSSKMID